MRKDKKGGISVEWIIVAIIAVLVLVTIWLVWTGQFDKVKDFFQSAWDVLTGWMNLPEPSLILLR